MQLHQIRYFLATCETLNFTRAAEKCHVSQPALTRAIQKLENELKGPLFRREGNNTHLTDLGRVMREYLSRVEDSSRAAERAARDFCSLDKAPLSLAVMCTIGPKLVSRFLLAFRSDFPGIELSIHDVSLEPMTEGLLGGRFDCALYPVSTPIHQRFQSQHLYSERIMVIFSEGHRFQQMSEVSLSEFAGEQYLDRLNCEVRGSFFKLMEKQGIEVSVPYSSEREDWIQAMVAQGLGICLLAEHSLILTSLLSRPVVDPVLKRDIELVTVAGREHSPAIQTLIEKATAFPWLDPFKESA